MLWWLLRLYWLAPPLILLLILVLLYARRKRCPLNIPWVVVIVVTFMILTIFAAWTQLAIWQIKQIPIGRANPDADILGWKDLPEEPDDAPDSKQSK